MNQRIRLNKYQPLEGALDFSWLLDKPAGCHGFVTAKNGHLYYEDGTRARFIGFNFPVRSGLPDHESADVYAKRLAGLGCNVVRIHAVDIFPNAAQEAWATEPDAPLLDYASGSTRNFHPVGLEHLDYFVWKLKEQGIYVHLDLNVARGYMPGDDTDYDEAFPQGGKGTNILNRRLRKLQQEFAEKYLTHLNPYTGLRYIDDPCVMAVQLLNEDSVFFIPDKRRSSPRCRAYYEELRRRFNYFLLAKYDTCAHLREAWTENGVCALNEGEDPEKGTVQLIRLDIDDMWPNLNDPLGAYEGLNSPARYADFNEFGIAISRDYYGEMIHHLHSIGVRVPIACSNLVHGAVDVYCESDADLHENNGYWNHPFFGEVPDPRDMITTDPRFFGVARPPVQAGQQFQQHAEGVMKGKPFGVTEWNEYGSMQYHSASIMMTIAYACLQDWDAMILYCYQTQGKSAFDQPDDFVANIMESYNDPAVICQHGAMAAMFLKGLIAPAKNRAEVCFTMSDLKLMPPTYPTVFSFLPYITKVETMFLDHGDAYIGDDELVVSGGYTCAGDYSRAKHAIVWNASKYADGFRRYDLSERNRALHTEKGSEAFGDLGVIGEHIGLLENYDAVKDTNDLTAFSRFADACLKKWGIIPEDCGLIDNRTFVSDTGEIRYTPEDSYFTAANDRFFLFAGDPKEELSFGRFSFDIRNRRMTLSCVPLDGGDLKDTCHVLLTTVGECGNDESHFEGKKHILKGKLAIDSPEGTLKVKGAVSASLNVLDPYGKTLAVLEGTKGDDGVVFELNGEYPSANYELVISK